MKQLIHPSRRERLSILLGASVCLLGLPFHSTAAGTVEDRPASVPPATPELSAHVEVDTASRGVAYDRMLFGGFLEHFHRQVYGGVYEPGSPLADERGFRRDVLAAVKELRMPIVRWPGGCFVSAYHWKEGVGKDRQPSFDKAWGVEEPNTFGTDEFVEWCRRAGLEPYICGNAGTGTPEEMSDWVEYCNQTQGRWARWRAANGHAEPFRVRYWSVGNENWGGHEIGAKTAQEWGLFVRETAKMIRRVDRTVVLTAAALDDGWNRNLLQHAAQNLDLISIHGYWDYLWSEDKPSDYATCMLRSTQPEEAIVTVERLLESTGHKGRIGIAFDEWNLRGWHHPGVIPGFSAENIRARDRNDLNSTYSMADALFSACFLNACLRHADTVKMANIAPLVNTRGPLFTHQDGIVKRTTYHVLHMFANLLGSRVGAATVRGDAFQHGSESVPAVDAVATCDERRAQWRLVLVNRHPSATARCALRFDGAPVSGSLPATLLVGDSPDAFNDVNQPERVKPVRSTLEVKDGAVRLPAHSVTVVEIGREPAPIRWLDNGGFESGSPTGGVRTWTTNRWGDGAYQAQWTEDRPHAGRRCVLLRSTEGADCAWSQRVEVDPHTRYRLSGWARTEGVAAGSGRGAFLNVQEIQDVKTQVLTGTTDWVRLTLEFDSGARSNVQVNCLLGGWGRSTGACWFDDLELEPVGSSQAKAE